MNKRLLIIFLYALISIVGKAQSEIMSKSLRDKLIIKEQVYFYEDTSNKLIVLDFLFDSSLYQFKPVIGNSFNPGFSKSSFWLKINLENVSAKNKELLFVIAYPLLNNIKFYEVENNLFNKEIVTGEYLPFQTREVTSSSNFVFRMNLPPNSHKTFYTYIYNNGETIRLPLVIMDKWDYFVFENIDLGVNALYYGFLLFALMINLFFFISIRDKLYLFFSLYVLFLSLFLFNVDGLSYRFFWSQSPWWANHSTILFVSLANLFLIHFSVLFLKVKKELKLSKDIFLILMVLSVVFVIGSIFPHPIHLYIIKGVNYFTFLNVIVILFVTVFAIRLKVKASHLFFLSFLLLFIGTTIYVMRNTGILPLNIFTKYGMKLGFAIQIMFLTFAVAERFRKLMKETQENLEVMVKERTFEIEQQSNELGSQRDEMETQRDYIIQQRDKIIIQNKEITDSIRYAQQIQKATLPATEITDKILGNNHFVIFLPRDIVSGDFYWICEKNGVTYLVVADCTGHGVPGAFMSLLGITLLNEVISILMFNHQNNNIPANKILNELTTLIISTLNQNKEKGNLKDGIDLSLCVIDKSKKEIQFAGAMSSIYLISNDKFQEIKGDRLSIGINYRTDLEFTNHLIHYNEDDVLYLSTDGYIDQFGGGQNKTFKSRRFKNLLQEISHKPMSEQKDILTSTFHAWKGNKEQTDDVLVMGIRL